MSRRNYIPQWILSMLQEIPEPLPELVVERVLKRRCSNDESEEFICSLKKRMRPLIRKPFNIERDGSSSPVVLPVHPLEKKHDNLLKTNGDSKKSNGTLSSSKKETINTEICIRSYSVTQDDKKIDKSYKVIQNDKKIDEVEIMRSHNLSLSTQSLEAASNSSSSPQNVHLERRNEMFSIHSWVSDRDSVELDIVATTPVDTGFLEDFPPFLRCSTPIDHVHSDDNFDFNCSPVLHLNSERRPDMPSKSIVEEQASDEVQNPPSTSEEIHAPETLKAKEVPVQTVRMKQHVIDIGVQAQEREKDFNCSPVQHLNSERRPNTPSKSLVGEQASDEVQNLPSTSEEIHAPVTLESKEVSVQTVRMEQHVIHIGVQVQEREKEVRCVQVQTDEDDVFLRRGLNYLIFL